MNTLDSQSEKVVGNTELEPISIKIRILHALIGLVVGTIPFISSISKFIFSILIYNRKIPDFTLGEFFSCSGIVLLCLLCASSGIVGGEIGYVKGHKYLGAVLGGLLCCISPFILLVLLSILLILLGLSGGWSPD